MSVGSYTKQSVGGGMITIQSLAANLKAFQDFAKVVPIAAAAAQRRAINKTLGWLRTHIARAVSRQEKIAVTAVRQRLRSYPVRGGSSQGKLWFGINPLEASRIGRPNQSASGVSVGGRRYKGAFYKRVYGSNADIWIRTGSKQFSAEDYPGSTDGRRASGFVKEAYGRFPLAKAKVMLEDIRPLFNTWSRLADARLLEILRQELNYELQKYLKGAGRV